MNELKLLEWEYETVTGQYMAPNTLKYMNEELGLNVSQSELELVYRAFDIYNFILAYDVNAKC